MMPNERVASMRGFDPNRVETPAFVCDLSALRGNLSVLRSVQERAGCSILLALKGFAMWSTFPIIRESLVGVAASSTAEARLGRERFGKEVHAYAPAYCTAEVAEHLELVDHMVFNSTSQWERFRPMIEAAPRRVECALRLNPEHSEVDTALYDPCAPGSRLGVRPHQLEPQHLEGLSGLHFHTLCEKNSDALERTLAVVEAKFGWAIERVNWVNFGGGHHITRRDYDIERLVRVVETFRQRWGKAVYLEPGEAVGLDTGVLVASVLDIIEASHGGLPIAILDTSATAHMPDILEMPYRPRIVGGAEIGALPHGYRLGGLTCLAGDVIGDWSFARPLEVGDRLVFEDMIHYTMVKTTTFNGVRLPDIVTYDPEDGGRLDLVRRFGYEDYAGRLS
jgi:carboxynorspermidine decarboxylase